MSGGFFGRWSQRKLSGKDKQEAQRETSDAVDGAGEALESAARGNQPQDDAQDVSAAPQQEEILSEEELAALPSLDSITTQTDLRQFLRKGVPGALKNAALRKMWLLDPAIRNHVDCAVDYAWDWNVTGGVPGHGGQIAGESVAKMLERLLPKPVSDENGSVSETPGPVPAAGRAVEEEPGDRVMQPPGDHHDVSADHPGVPSEHPVDNGNPGIRQVSKRRDAQEFLTTTVNDSDAMSRAPDEARLSPRRHGGALPQ